MKAIVIFLSRARRIIDSHEGFAFSAVMLLLFTGLNRAAGFGEKTILAYYHGASAESDAFLVCQGIFFTCWAFVDRIISPTLIPILQRENGVKGAGNLYLFLPPLICIAGPMVILFFLSTFGFPDLLAAVFYPGFDAEKRAMVGNLLPYFAIGGAAYFLTPIFHAYSASLGKFWPPALLQSLCRITMVLCFFVFSDKAGIYIGGATNLIYSVGYFILLLLFLLTGDRLNYRWKERPGTMVEFFRLCLPLALAFLVSQADQWLEISLASRLEEGTISLLAYSKKLVDVPVALGSLSIGFILLPYLSKYHIQSKYRNFRLLLKSCSFFCLFAYSALFLAYILFGGDLLKILSQGRFDQEKAATLHVLVLSAAPGLLFLPLETVLIQACLALRTPWLVFWIGSLCSLVGMGLLLSSVSWLGILAFPISNTIQKGLKTILLALFLRRRLLDLQTTATLAPAYP